MQCKSYSFVNQSKELKHLNLLIFSAKGVTPLHDVPTPTPAPVPFRGVIVTTGADKDINHIHTCIYYGASQCLPQSDPSPGARKLKENIFFYKTVNKSMSLELKMMIIDGKS